MRAEILVPHYALKVSEPEPGDEWKGKEGAVASWLGSMARQPDGTDSQFTFMFWKRSVALNAATAIAISAGTEPPEVVEMSHSELVDFFEELLAGRVDSALAIGEPNFEVSCFLFNMGDALQLVRERQEAIDALVSPVPVGPFVEAVSMRRPIGM